ncbi:MULTISPECIES: type II toxin-antitoxin system HicA family toxin [unclassified Gemella]|uniref:type II toxin-antitoxin system HicA family toxin n=1 Tax=unclassified Gemella TaxID=2624949 RepID=UPI001D16D2F7|nr:MULTISPECIES: type II toxin-antitoxin system HicA family toxin [unclassified Gemella]
MTQEEMVKLLISKGFSKIKGGKGSHIKITKKGLRRPIIIPKGELRKGTERGILKEAGLL